MSSQRSSHAVVLTRPLLALIAAEVLSSLGSLMSVVALPWFVLQTTGSPSRMGLVLAAESAPLLIVGIPSSRAVASLGSRNALLACDAIWAPLTALIPILHYAGALPFPLLIALAFLSGVPLAAHYGSQNAVIPELLGECADRIAQANALFQTLSRLTYFVGPALGGVLVVAFGAPTVLLIDAGSFAASFALVAAFVRPTANPVEEEEAGSIAGGWRFIRTDSWMRPITSARALSQAAFVAMSAAIPVLAFTTYDRNARLAGILLGVWGGGALVGGIAAYRLVESHDPYRLGAVAWVIQALALWLIPISGSPAVAIAALIASGLANGVRVPPITGVTTRRIPPAVRGETMTVSETLVLGAGFLALLAAGPALGAFSLDVVWATIAALQTLAALVYTRAAIHHSANLDEAAPTPPSPNKDSSAAPQAR